MPSDDVTRVRVTTISIPILGKVDVDAGDDGYWYADVVDEEFNAPSLDALERMLTTYGRTYELEVPFVSANGRQGVMRGFHASSREILVTWNDGKKGRLGQYDRVFPVGELDETEVALMLVALEEIEQRHNELGRLRERSIMASALYTEEVGDDLFSKRRR
jgi:hypothetical protein